MTFDQPQNNPLQYGNMKNNYKTALTAPTAYSEKILWDPVSRLLTY